VIKKAIQAKQYEREFDILDVPSINHRFMEWNIDLLSDASYIIKNHGYTSSANSTVHAKASPGDKVVGGTLREQWQIIETQFNGHFWYALPLRVDFRFPYFGYECRICPMTDTNVCWSLKNGKDHCPVRLDPSDLPPVT
jgi:hypothetical protein